VQNLHHLVAAELAQVEQIIQQQLSEQIPLLVDVGQHILGGKAKRIRPLMHLLTAKALQQCTDAHLTLAAVIELFHTATLLHDDVVDNSEQRRGRQTANTLWGNRASILVGDYIYTRCFQLLVGLQQLDFMQTVADATNKIAKGELLQLQNQHNPEITLEQYLAVIDSKTAALFTAASKLGAQASFASADSIAAMQQYGYHVGMAFQLIDDALDYQADGQQLGKNVGDDLADGKITLPLIYALQQANAAEQQLIRQAIKQGQLEALPQIQQIIQDTRAIEYTQQCAEQHSEHAIQQLNVLTESPFKNALQQLAASAVHRHS
jgi:octaprenyl-diphosphate synthase